MAKSKLSINNKLMIVAIIASILFIACTQVNEQTNIKENPPIVTKWALGHIVWENSVNTQTAATDLVNQYAENDIPIA